MEPISLSKNQNLESIRVEPADNGGCVLRYTIYTPSKLNSESSWDEKTEVYQDNEFEEVVLPRIVALYRAEYTRKKSDISSK